MSPEETEKTKTQKDDLVFSASPQDFDQLESNFQVLDETENKKEDDSYSESLEIKVWGLPVQPVGSEYVCSVQFVDSSSLSSSAFSVEVDKISRTTTLELYHLSNHVNHRVEAESNVWQDTQASQFRLSTLHTQDHQCNKFFRD